MFSAAGPGLVGAGATAMEATDNDFSALVFPTLADAGESRGPGEDRARIERQWQARGHAAGYTEGLRAAAAAVDARVAGLEAEHAELMRATDEQHDRTLAGLNAAVRALEERTVPVLHDVEDTLLDAAIDLAEAIIGHTLADETAAVRAALGRTIADGPAGAPAAGRTISHTTGRTVTHTVRLNPHDLAALDVAAVAEAGVTLVADASLSRGDAVSEFPDGYLDARIGSALQRARAALAGGTA
ncbi:FliH/SctL family protein [Cryobacterium sp. SO1]|uniref:FliH/SctL family protein n=1 Tax=Cryobacterium sp. SO1 TaxID=1897061 RepID=UPI00210B807B|nr:FliH/SctL family protein [Cryobacterium sp. SO1]